MLIILILLTLCFVNDFLSQIVLLGHKLCLMLLTTPNSNSLIDLDFLSSPNDLIVCETVPPLSNSDHLGLQLEVSIPTRCVTKV